MSPGCNPDKEPLPLDEQELEEDLIATDEEEQWVTGTHGEELYEHYRVRVDPGQTPLRIDRFLVDRMPHTSRHRIQLAAKSGLIWVDGAPVKSNYKVKPLETITMMLAHPKQDWSITPEDIPLDIVYEDDQLLVVNKPAGMVVHPGHGNYSGTLVHALAYYLRNDPLYDPNDASVGLVHRIDKDTSGLLLVAKRTEAKIRLARQFFLKTTGRRYQALVWGKLDQPQGTIEGNIARDPRDRTRMTVYPPTSEIGKPAVTHYTELERLGFVTLIACELETGRTHQIRAHMKSIDHPLFGDERYGGDQILWGQRTSSYQQFVNNCLKICPRQALHAETLAFDHPTTGERMHFSAALPDDMSQLIEKWRRYVAPLELSK